jgi:crotonobetainyl-CoA:carnitine CoA-transferase CaiB-like acyl-CoA transferase
MTKTAANPGPLSGIRVLDIGAILAGPMAATHLADFGADVIKVELPGRGDPIRGMGVRCKGQSLSWLVDGRNKRSITLDLRKPAGRDLLLKLLETADVLIENFMPGTMEDWGLDEATMRKAKTDLILVRVSAFGQHELYSDRPGFDAIALAFSGVTYISGYPDRPPTRPGIPIADLSTGYQAAMATMIALYYRDARGGKGQTIDIALYQTMFSMTRDLVAAYELNGRVRERYGNTNPGISPGGAYEGSDGSWVLISSSTDSTWRRLAGVLGREELLSDPRFTTNTDRVANNAVLDAIVAEWVRGRPGEEAIDKLRTAGVPAGKAFSAADIAKDPHHSARSLVTVQHPELGEFRIPDVVARLSETPGSVRSLGPALGEHNDEIYGDMLGLSQAELRELRAAAVI